jgi:hypothetical protein
MSTQVTQCPTRSPDLTAPHYIIREIFEEIFFADFLLTAEEKKASISLESDATSLVLPRRFKANFKL